MQPDKLAQELEAAELRRRASIEKVAEKARRMQNDAVHDDQDAKKRAQEIELAEKIDAGLEAAEARHRSSLENISDKARRTQNAEFHVEQNKKLQELAAEVTARERALLDSRLTQAVAQREHELEKKAEKARTLSGLDRHNETKEKRAALQAEILQKEQDLLEARFAHAAEVRAEQLRRKSVTAANIDFGTSNRQGLEPLQNDLERQFFDKEAELYQIREDHAEAIHKAALADRLRRIEAVNHADRVAQTKELLDMLNAERAKKEIEDLEARTAHALERRSSSLEDVALKAHKAANSEKASEIKTKLEANSSERLAAQRSNEELKLKSAEERRRASLENISAKAHSSANLEKYSETRAKLAEEEQRRVEKLLAEEEERSAASYDRRRRSFEAIAAKAHRTANLEKYAEARSQLDSLSNERRLKRLEEIEQRATLAAQRKLASLEHKAQVAHADIERVARDVARHEEMERQKKTILIADQKLQKLNLKEQEEQAPIVPKPAIAPVPNNTPAALY